MLKIRFQVLALATLLSVAAASSLAVSPTGGFFTHLNANQNFSDSPRSVSYYDTDDFGSGPLFSVALPGEAFEDGAVESFNYEEVGAIAVDPTNGDTYVLSFDSTGGGSVGDTEMNPGVPLDTLGTWDIYKIDFQLAYDHWSNNFEGNLAAEATGVGGPAPFVPAGVSAGAFDDYVTYGVGPVGSFSGTFDPRGNGRHSNAFVLPGVIQKIAEVKRNEGSGDFFDPSLEFINADTLIILDDSTEPTDNDTTEGDHDYRIVQRVSTSPGAANDAVGDFLDGGYNNGTTESWNSTRIGKVARDFAGGVPSGHSEPESIAYHEDVLTGVRGIWVTEADGGGDDIAFYEIDSNGNGIGYRPHAVGGGPDFPTSFALDNDPFTDSSTNDGKAEHIFVDSDTGDLIIVESGFADTTDGVAGGDHEPGVIRREVLSYDDGNGRIQFGAWSEKIITTPEKDGPSDAGFLERGHWAAYDSETDRVFFINPGGGDDTSGGQSVAFQNDIMVLDIATGITTNYNNVDESVALFFGASFGDVADAFFLTAQPELIGDYNGDDVVDAADYTIWRDNLGGDASALLNRDPNNSGFVSAADYDTWKAAFGNTATVAASAAVPEPSSSLLVLFALVSLGFWKRN